MAQGVPGGKFAKIYQEPVPEPGIDGGIYEPRQGEKLTKPRSKSLVNL